ncbi:hypothetical protein ACOZ4N_00595 (plasmid) [Halorientalis pallida]|uniref:hypothetical protein n=1 Tax=Halorientalis pallida TaxID=2479928 RepID=UPI003C6F3713
MKIKSECIYEHRDHGEVLVLGISTEYDSYDTTEADGVDIGTFVQYAREWDGYGAMPSAATKAPINEFTEAVGNQIRDFDRVSVNE